MGQGHEGQGKKYQSQGRRLSVKIVCKVLYPIHSLEVRHAGVFIMI